MHIIVEEGAYYFAATAAIGLMHDFKMQLKDFMRSLLCHAINSQFFEKVAFTLNCSSITSMDMKTLMRRSLTTNLLPHTKSKTFTNI